jgi:NAD(P)-dependent dehydrogenase (short-subunit alcohol dehydrogenase family)
MVRTLALQWAPNGVCVNTLAPTHFRTPLIERGIEENPGLHDHFVGIIPLGRLGDPEEVVGPGVFLGSGASSTVTGRVLVVDGGHTA